MITRKQRTADVEDGKNALQFTQENSEHSNNQTIKDLETDIQLLEQRLMQFRDGQRQLDKNRSSECSFESVKDEIQELEQLIKENEILSGLTISETSFSVLKQDMKSSLRHHMISGEARGIPFSLQYDVQEQFEMMNAGEPKAEVLALEMDVQESVVSLLESHLHSVAADKKIREFFQLLSSFGAWSEDQERAVNYFSTTFPELVHREDDDNDEGSKMNMIICNSKQNIKFHIHWGLKVLPMMSVVPDLHLEVEASPEVLARDKKGTLKDAPKVFQMMCKKFGIEKALHMLVKLMDDVPS